MRKLLGGVVLALGVGGLGFYANNNNAKRMQTRILGEAAVVGMGSVHQVRTEVTGRDIRVSGIADSPEEREKLIAALNAVNGRRVVIDDLTVLEIASPYVFQSSKTAAGQTYAGMVPTEVVRAAFGNELKGAEATLDLKAGVPDDQWDEAVLQALSSMTWLQEGEFSVTDRAVVLTGKAATPPEKIAAEGIMAELPDGYSADVNITSILPLAKPFILSSEKTVTGQTYSGVVQSEEGREVLKSALGDQAEALVVSYGAPDQNWEQVGAKGLAALDVLQDGRMQLVDRVLTIEGRGLTPIEKAKAEALVETLPDGYSVATKISAIMQISSPYTLQSVKNGQVQTYTGDIPSEEARAELAKYAEKGVDDLVLAAGVPDADWINVAANGLEALSSLDEGKLEITDRVVMLSGTAMTPAERDASLAVIARISEPYRVGANIDVLDDGLPAAYSILFHPVTGANVEGKLPKGMSPKAIASALGLRSVSGNPTIGRIGNTDAAVALSKRLNVMSDWLPDFESFSMSSDGTKTTIETKVAAGVDQGQVQAALAKAFGETVKVTVSGAKLAVDAGAVRETVLGDKQIFSGGFWLPVVDRFEPSAANCQSASNEILATSKVNFVTGSATLDAKSVRTVNSIASIMLQCLEGTGLNVEVGGHTDSSGSHAFNVKLSQSRADAVVDELVARGISADLVSAKGFGPDMPIASNETDTGKAANRRTTIRWYVPEVETMPESTSTDAGTAPTTQVSE